MQTSEVRGSKCWGSWGSWGSLEGNQKRWKFQAGGRPASAAEPTANRPIASSAEELQRVRSTEAPSQPDSSIFRILNQQEMAPRRRRAGRRQCHFRSPARYRKTRISPVSRLGPWVLRIRRDLIESVLAMHDRPYGIHGAISDGQSRAAPWTWTLCFASTTWEARRCQATTGLCGSLRVLVLIATPRISYTSGKCGVFPAQCNEPTRPMASGRVESSKALACITLRLARYSVAAG